MKISLSKNASSRTWLEIHTQQWRIYSTDVFEESILAALVGQNPGDNIDELVIRRGTSIQQVLSGNLEDIIKAQIVEILIAR